MKISIFALLAFSLPALASETRTLVVSGECQRRVAQDRVAITLSAEFLETTPTLASSKTTQVYNQLRDKIKKLNLKDAEYSTSEYSLNEDFEWIKNVQKSKGFRARQSLTVETADLGKIGEALKVAQELGIKRISGLSTFVSQELLKTEREACLEEAFKNAKSKAERLAKASNSKVGPVLEMNEIAPQSTEFPSSRFKRMEMVSADMQSGAAPSIDSKSEMIQTSLKLIFQIL
jgi:uncharacterized protein YggE